MSARRLFKVDELAGAPPYRSGREIFAMVDAALDESGIHDGAKVCVIAGFFGEIQPMRDFEKAWLATLSEFHFPLADFHAKDLVGRPKYEPMLLALARTISEQREVFPISQAILVDDFFSFPLAVRRWMTGGRQTDSGKWRESGCPGKPYFVPFQTCLAMVTDHTAPNDKARFAFGLDQTFSKYALAIFSQIQRQIANGVYPSEWKSKDRLGTPSFPLASQTPQLQAADLFVHLSYRRVIECIAANDLEYQNAACPMLEDCIRNTLKPEHHGIMNRQSIEYRLMQGEKYALRLKAAARKEPGT